jgi:hypothetical protein
MCAFSHAAPHLRVDRQRAVDPAHRTDARKLHLARVIAQPGVVLLITAAERNAGAATIALLGVDLARGGMAAEEKKVEERVESWMER